MFAYRYKLGIYHGSMTRFTCPSCGKRKVFTRYIDIDNGHYIDERVGRCNREVKCGYHFAPKDFFSRNRQLVNSTYPKSIPSNPPKQRSKIPLEAFSQSVDSSFGNHLHRYLESLFGERLASKLIQRYLVGSSNHWPGATVFWQIDQRNNIRAGKIILYNSSTGKRVKTPFPHITWIHKILKLPEFELNQCFFGEHLLRNTNHSAVAIVESEKTAIISSVYMPQFLWLATGGALNLNLNNLKPLKGRKILLFPDLGYFEAWKLKAMELEVKLKNKIIVSDYLEKNATLSERQQGLDLADFLVKRDEMFGWALSKHGYPIFWDKL